MKWLKHFSDSRKNPKLRAVERRFGEVGYARFFRLLEVIAERGGSGEMFVPRVDLKNQHTDLLWLSEEIGTSTRETKRSLDFFASVQLIDQAAWQEQVVFIPQMLSYRDEFTTRRQRALSEPNPDSVPIQSRLTPAQKESTEGEKEKRKAARAAPFKKSAAAQAREDERRRQQISPEGAALLKKFSGES